MSQTLTFPRRQHEKSPRILSRPLREVDGAGSSGALLRAEHGQADAGGIDRPDVHPFQRSTQSAIFLHPSPPVRAPEYNCEQGGIIIIIAHSATLKLFDPAIP
jgi:hypothetical protein